MFIELSILGTSHVPDRLGTQWRDGFWWSSHGPSSLGMESKLAVRMQCKAGSESKSMASCVERARCSEENISWANPWSRHFIRKKMNDTYTRTLSGQKQCLGSALTEGCFCLISRACWLQMWFAIKLFIKIITLDGLAWGPKAFIEKSFTRPVVLCGILNNV